jgi:hypothetical protein
VSALPLKEEIKGCERYVSDGPTAEIVKTSQPLFL